MISAMSSGSGKTVVTCGLLALLKKRGYHVRSVKCGPDYIDPMFHSRVLGVEGENADLFLMGEKRVREILCGNPDHMYEWVGEAESFGEALVSSDSANEWIEERSYVLAEGAMGFYDGIGGTADNSAWDIADRTDTPVLLIIRSKGQSLSLAAQVRGFLNFRKPSHISGVILTDCSPSLYAHLKPILEHETGLTVFGYLPAMAEAEIPSRHLGLVTADEISDLRKRFEKIAAQMEKTVDVEGLLRLFQRDACEEALSGPAASDFTAGDSGNKCDVPVEDSGNKCNAPAEDSGKKCDAPAECAGNDGAMSEKAAGNVFMPTHECTVSEGVCSCRIAVAHDEAFCFYYAESLRALREAGAEPVFFSPVHDKCLPDDISGLYLGGGYPELYAGELSENREMLAKIREAVKAKMPLIAECGGFLYLQKYLEDESGTVHEMAGAFSGTGRPTGHLVRFGYLYMTALQDSLLFREGEVIPAHEFHHWDTDDNGRDLEAVRARGGQPWQCAYVSESMYAGFPHISLGGEVPLAERFVERMKEFLSSFDRAY